MFNQSFIVSYLTFYLKAVIVLEGNFFKISNPNTILKLIPLGKSNRTIPIEQIASVDNSFRLDIKSFVWGLVVVLASFSMYGDNFVPALIISLYGLITVASSFQTLLNIHTTSGAVTSMNVVIFEKGKLENLTHTIEKLIDKRYDDTNVAKHTSENTDRLIDAIKENK